GRMLLGFDLLPRPFEEGAARLAEDRVVLVLASAFGTDDHAGTTSTCAGMCAGFDASTSALRRRGSKSSGSVSSSRTVSRGSGLPGRGLSGFVDQATPPLSTISGSNPVRIAMCSASPRAVPRKL